jgi:alkanesulfonate monooxygenase SsuD/methylene tetrahydromethanopterin reductase-like flavin-dependent oxidoreductase (luciferase family)
VDIGIGLPHTLDGAGRDGLLDWAARADRAGFSTVATLDRLVYRGYESLITLAAAASVTSRCRLTTSILISPLHTNTALFAKQAASIDRLSEGRLVLGLAVGARQDDFKASGVNPGTRGRVLDRQVDEVRRIWAGERRGFAGGIGPQPTRPGGPELILGGHAPAAVARAARLGDGWISGSGGVGMFRQGADAYRSARRELGRDGEPRLLALAYFALGPDAAASADAYLGEYYGFAPPYAQLVRRSALVDEATLVRTAKEYEQAGCHELILMPCSAQPDQVDRLAAAVGL